MGAGKAGSVGYGTSCECWKSDVAGVCSRGSGPADDQVACVGHGCWWEYRIDCVETWIEPKYGRRFDSAEDEVACFG